MCLVQRIRSQPYEQSGEVTTGRNYNSERPEAGKELGILEGTKKSTGLEVEYYEKGRKPTISIREFGFYSQHSGKLYQF